MHMFNLRFLAGRALVALKKNCGCSLHSLGLCLRLGFKKSLLLKRLRHAFVKQAFFFSLSFFLWSVRIFSLLLNETD